MRGDEHDPRRQVVAVVAIGWFPLLAWAGLEVLLDRSPERLIFQLSVHTRTLVALPLWIVTEHVLDGHCSSTLDRFATEALSAVERISRSANRLRLSWWPELLLLGVAFVLGQFTLWRIIGETGVMREPTDRVTLDIVFERIQRILPQRWATMCA